MDLLAWLPREDRDRRIWMLVIRWRRVKPEAVREAEISPEIAATRYTLRQEAHAPVPEESVQLEQNVISEEERLDPWTERARCLRPQWTSE